MKSLRLSIRAAAVLAIGTSTLGAPPVEAAAPFGSCVVCSNTCEFDACRTWCPNAAWPPFCSTGGCMGEHGGFYWETVSCELYDQ
jgi:hypothetical protein